ncbi:MAG: M48 family metallopeptidase [Desulfobacteraceae bacterium]|jgi:Zn-dependent protease with chaperone function|nr:M48 family metallopeptidase [Desulfobacteraceae bacterium]MBT4365321.1 M48 family metallopeptidase [Desulfobacteraceae bacterium]
MRNNSNTDFFAKQDKARKKTAILFLYFIPAIIITVLVISIFIHLFISSPLMLNDFIRFYGGYQVDNSTPWYRPGLYLWVLSIVTWLVIFSNLVKIREVSRGGGIAIAEMLGGRVVNPGSKNPGERKLLNVVEEMAIASGIPVPMVFVMDRVEGINAFAAGFSPEDTVISATMGCIRYLDRDELQGVIAHEFSHILNGDMVLNSRFIGMLHGILFFSLLGARIMKVTGKPGDNAGIFFYIFGLFLQMIGSIGVFFGKLIKCAVSRQREFLADAYAVQFTRNPMGLAGALKKIGGLRGGSRVYNAYAEIVSHLFFSNGLRQPFMKSMATHPPIEDRILKLDKYFDGTYPVMNVYSDLDEDPFGDAVTYKNKDIDKKHGELSLEASGGEEIVRKLDGSYIIGSISSTIGNPQANHILYASALISGLHDKVAESVHDPYGACAVIYCLLLDKKSEIRKSQIERLKRYSDNSLMGDMKKLIPLIDSLGRETRLPLVDMAIPSLKHLSRVQYVAFRDNMKRLAEADKKVSIFEYTLQCIIIRCLDPLFLKSAPSKSVYYTIEPIILECFELLSFLSWHGTKEEAVSDKSFNSGMAELQNKGGYTILPIEKCNLKTFDRALKKITAASPGIKKRVLNACSICVAVDSKITINEAELLRAVADSLGCPLPLFFQNYNT